MLKHIYSNLVQRPTRTLVSVLAISIGVVLILVSVGLSYGQLNDAAERTRRVGGDIMVQPPNASLFFALNSALLTALLLPLFWQPVSSENLLWLVLLAMLGWSGQFLLTRGFAQADAGRLGVYAYFSVLFGALYGWWFWDEMMTWITIAGGLLVILAGLLAGDRRNIP